MMQLVNHSNLNSLQESQISGQNHIIEGEPQNCNSNLVNILTVLALNCMTVFAISSSKNRTRAVLTCFAALSTFGVGLSRQLNSESNTNFSVREALLLSVAASCSLIYLSRKDKKPSSEKVNTRFDQKEIEP